MIAKKATFTRKMEEKKIEKINFFKKVWYSTSKFEKYPIMAAQGLGSAIKYLIIIVAIVSIFLTINSIKEMYSAVEKISAYIESDIPEFLYENGKLTMEVEEPIIISNTQYSGIDKAIIDASADTTEKKSRLKEENGIIGTTIYFFNDEIVLKTKLEGNQELEKSYTYDEFIKSYTQEEISKFNKAELVEYLTSSKMNAFYVRNGASLYIYILLIDILVALLDAVELAIIGWVTSWIARIKLKTVAIYNMAIHSLTLPMILNIIYIVINYFTDFKIEYFQIAYIAIAYIYLAAAIFILKDDVIKRQIEVAKIREEQKKVREEILEQQDDKKDDEQEDDKEEKEEKQNGKDQEPKGSEA